MSPMYGVIYTCLTCMVSSIHVSHVWCHLYMSHMYGVIYTCLYTCHLYMSPLKSCMHTRNWHQMPNRRTWRRYYVCIQVIGIQFHVYAHDIQFHVYAHYLYTMYVHTRNSNLCTHITLQSYMYISTLKKCNEYTR